MQPHKLKNIGIKIYLLCLLLLLAACQPETNTSPQSAEKPALAPISQPAILLVTLDTTRADSTGIETDQVATPNLQALAASGRYYQQAYSVTPTTLPSHLSMMTGLYPADHHVRENGRMLDKHLDLLAVQMKKRGYETGAFVSGFPLAGQFGLSRGFDHYDDSFIQTAASRSGKATTDLAIDWLKQHQKPSFLWVHYYDAHEPYQPPEPFKSQYKDPYLGEIAFMDQQFGRLLQAFKQQYKGQAWKVIVVGDHGEGRGDHGETLHGNLIYQATMRVPLLLAGSDIATTTITGAVSVRQVFNTVLSWVGEQRQGSLMDEPTKPVLAEALKPYQQYGWQPQFMAVLNGVKVIQSGDIEIFNVLTDPGETHNLDGELEPEAAIWDALEDYTRRALAAPAQTQTSLSQSAQDKLASLGYISSSGSSKVRDDAPNPRDMAYLFHDMDIGAGLFIRKDYPAAIPVFKRILAADPQNFMAALRLAVAYSVTRKDALAQQFFDRAREIDPASTDLQHYQAMHYLITGQWELAQPLFESVLAVSPERLPALEGLAKVYAQQGELNKAIHLLEKVVKIKESPGLEWNRIGRLRMALHDTKGGIYAFEKARALLGDKFRYRLELGMLYMADRRLMDAANSFDHVSPQHPGYAIALYKRAQVSVLLGESDRQLHVHRAWLQANDKTRGWIETEPLFKGIQYRQEIRAGNR